MKKLLLACIIAAAPVAWAADVKPAAAPLASPAATAIAGEVLEVQNVQAYTYLKLRTAQGETWAAVPTANVAKGAKVTIQNPMVMEKFESKGLKKTFDKIVFGTLGDGSAPAAHGGSALATVADPDAKVAKASGPNAHTVAEIAGKPAAVKDKTVVLRGKVVKYMPGIMGKNWLHMRDGSGSAKDSTNEVVVTTKDAAKAGEIVTVKGVVHTDRDIGAGYKYKVLIEDASLQK